MMLKSTFVNHKSTLILMRRLKSKAGIGLMLVMAHVSATATSLYGHRGARGLAPENTLPAYQVALAHHVDFVDLDVGMTKDHIVIAQHDLSLNPDITRDAKGRWIRSNTMLVKNLTLKEIQTYDVGRIKAGTQYAAQFPQQHAIDGTSIPTLIQVIRYVKTHAKKKTGFQIEIKTDPTTPDATFSPETIAQAVATIIHDEKIADRTEVQAYDWRCLQALQKIDPSIKTAYITDIEQEKIMKNPNAHQAGLWTNGHLLKNYHHSIPNMIAAMGGKGWDPQDIEVTPDTLKEAHRLGLKVVTWTWVGKYGDESNLSLSRKLITMGIDGIITDRPDLVSKAIQQVSALR